VYSYCDVFAFFALIVILLLSVVVGLVMVVARVIGASLMATAVVISNGAESLIAYAEGGRCKTSCCGRIVRNARRRGRASTPTTTTTTSRRFNYHPDDGATNKLPDNGVSLTLTSPHVGGNFYKGNGYGPGTWLAIFRGNFKSSWDSQKASHNERKTNVSHLFDDLI